MTEVLCHHLHRRHQIKIAIVDGMVFVQNMTKKSRTINTVKDLAQCFNDSLVSLTAGFSEVTLVFDTFKPD